MDQHERDELLIRIDERVNAMREDDLPRIQNRLESGELVMEENCKRLYKLESDISWIKKIGAGFGTTLSALIALFRGGV